MENTLRQLCAKPLAEVFSKPPLSAGPFGRTNREGYDFQLLPFVMEYYAADDLMQPVVPLLRTHQQTDAKSIVYVMSGPMEGWKPKYEKQMSLYPYETRCVHLTDLKMAASFALALKTCRPERVIDLHQKVMGIVWLLHFVLPNSMLKDQVLNYNSVIALVRKCTALPSTILFLQPPPLYMRKQLESLCEGGFDFDQRWQEKEDGTFHGLDPSWRNVDASRLPLRAMERSRFYSFLRDYRDEIAAFAMSGMPNKFLDLLCAAPSSGVVGHRFRAGRSCATPAAAPKPERPRKSVGRGRSFRPERRRGG